jgi:L-amino acid N-acyltransferase YncA
MNDFHIEPLTKGSWEAVAAIYEQGIATGHATFETTAPDWNAWDTTHRKDCRLLARYGDRIAGWAALSDVSERCVYSGVAEVSVYIDADYRGRGIGDQLLKALIAASEAAGLWTLQAGIFPENDASITLHTRNGFRIVGTREKLGKMKNKWRDVVLLERRSKKIS